MADRSRGRVIFAVSWNGSAAGPQLVPPSPQRPQRMVGRTVAAGVQSKSDRRGLVRPSVRLLRRYERTARVDRKGVGAVRRTDGGTIDSRGVRPPHRIIHRSGLTCSTTACGTYISTLSTMIPQCSVATSSIICKQSKTQTFGVSSRCTNDVERRHRINPRARGSERAAICEAVKINRLYYRDGSRPSTSTLVVPRMRRSAKCRAISFFFFQFLPSIESHLTRVIVIFLNEKLQMTCVIMSAAARRAAARVVTGDWQRLRVPKSGGQISRNVTWPRVGQHPPDGKQATFSDENSFVRGNFFFRLRVEEYGQRPSVRRPLQRVGGGV